MAYKLRIKYGNSYIAEDIPLTAEITKLLKCGNKYMDNDISVEIYEDILWIYKDGVQCVPLTLNYTASSGSITDTGSYINMQYARGEKIGTYTSYAEAVIATTNTIDISGYTTIHVTGTNIVYPRLMAVCGNTDGLVNPTNTNGGLRFDLIMEDGEISYTSNGSFSHTFSITNFNINRIYVRTLCNTGHGGGDTLQTQVTNIWLE